MPGIIAIVLLLIFSLWVSSFNPLAGLFLLFFLTFFTAFVVWVGVNGNRF